jgi:hypothetical protein
VAVVGSAGAMTVTFQLLKEKYKTAATEIIALLSITSLTTTNDYCLISK